MAVFSIKDLEKLSGIKAHTIRIWEKRYGIIKPSRTSGNIRFYDDENLKLLLNVSYLNTRGQKISKIAKLSPIEIESQVSESASMNLDEDQKVDALTLSLLQLNKNKFLRFLDCNIAQHGFEHTMIHVVYPLLDKLSMLWINGSTKTVQENFIVNLIKEKIIGAIEKLGRNEPGLGKHFLIYLPVGESQELSLLFMQYLLKSRGHHIINLGVELELSHLEDICDIVQPDYVFTMINDPIQENLTVEDYKNELRTMFPESKLILTGFQVYAQNLSDSKNVFALASLDDTLAYLKTIKV